MITIQPAISQSDFEQISKLARIIWQEHYPFILSLAQIEYMLSAFNSVPAVEAQTKKGVLFFCIIEDDVPIGYTAIKQHSDYLFLEKLYLLKAYRGRKIAKYVIRFVETYAIDLGLFKIRLHVNKLNINSILAYKKMGFKKTRSMVTDIGNGFVMDDFEMEKIL